MSWYTRIASARSLKKEQLEFLLKEFSKLTEGCDIDKLGCEKDVDAIVKRMKRKKDRFLLSDEILSYVLESLDQAKYVLRDSPRQFTEIIEDAMITLDGELYELELKG
jgi:hypothetical protein